MAPLFVTPAVVLLPKVKGSLLGLSAQFWSGFVIGLSIVLLLAAIVAVQTRKQEA
jgi:tetrahydromethanopterin S-methyltransferase subunit B